MCFTAHPQKIIITSFIAKNSKLCDYKTTNNDHFMSTLIAPPETKVDSFKIICDLLRFVLKEQFAGTSNEDNASQLHIFWKVCDKQKYKEV